MAASFREGWADIANLFHGTSLHTDGAAGISQYAQIVVNTFAVFDKSTKAAVCAPATIKKTCMWG